MHINAISNGQGAPSMFLVVLAGEGQIQADISITADTGWENDMLWSTGERTSAREYFERVTRPLAEGYGIKAAFVRSETRDGEQYEPIPFTQDITHMDIPLYGSNGGQISQSCTSKWKIQAIRQELRRHGAKTATTALGLTLEEVHRMKPSDVKWNDHSWPLITDLKYYRVMCQDQLSKRNIPFLISTECDGCPHKNKSRWLRTSPEIINELAEFEARFSGEYFLTELRIPLRQAIEKMQNGQSLAFDSCDSGYCFT